MFWVKNAVCSNRSYDVCFHNAFFSKGLKTAHVGVALSDAEASIVSPFTSLDKNLSSVVDILLEGRCALASALASYKYVM
jgi:hypothetical protein